MPASFNDVWRSSFEAESAGLEPGILNPLVVRAMEEEGIDISGNKVNGVAEFLSEDRQYDYVITVCDESRAENCPVFPGKAERIHWSFADPSAFKGGEDEMMEQVRMVRDQIKNRIEKWAREVKVG